MMAVYNKGFTLVELLVTIGILATLMAILLPNFMGARERAKDAQKMQDLSAMKDALRMYYNDYQSYPSGSGGMLGVGFTYMANIRNLGYTYDYYQTLGGDGFVVCTGLDAGKGDDDTNSQAKCGVAGLGFGICGLGAGSTGDKVFVTCAK
jgi:prepilin-type N-terminal cleavage/methylation domain-containing protein